MIATSALNSIANAQTIKASEGNTKSTIFPVKHDNYLPPTPSTEQIKQRIADVSQEYGLDYDQLYSVIKCESEFKITYGDSGKAFGVAQFHKPTFDQYCKGNYCDTYDQ
ncbi:MAG: hypothetical protein NTY32_14675, partial [Bacteroidia bacterium]|nr:hypothetical protein [Bacteroidia bacterium]